MKRGQELPSNACSGASSIAAVLCSYNGVLWPISWCHPLVVFYTIVPLYCIMVTSYAIYGCRGVTIVPLCVQRYTGGFPKHWRYLEQMISSPQNLWWLTVTSAYRVPRKFPSRCMPRNSHPLCLWWLNELNIFPSLSILCICQPHLTSLS